MLALIVGMLVILLVMAVFSIDIAYMQRTRIQLRTATDAATRAASEALSRTQSVSQARQAALDVAELNPVANNPLSLDADDIIFGNANLQLDGTYTFTPGGVPVNGVRITGKRTPNAPDGSVNFLLASIIGRDTFEPIFQSTSLALDRDICLVLDRSGSMSGAKIQALKDAVNVFIDVLEASPVEERLALASYSTTGTKDHVLTGNLSAIRAIVNGYNAAGWTAIGQGLQIGTDSVEFDPAARPFAEKAIVLMTDGLQNRPPDVETVVPTVVARDHVCHTITFGSGADQVLMAQIAADTGGEHHHAPNSAALEDVFRELARALSVVLVQ